MCDFEDVEIISKYPLSQAIEDGMLYEVMRFNKKPIVATASIHEELGYSDLIDIWHEFREWKKKVEPTLPEEERLFKVFKKGMTIWLIEDGAAYTFMQPHEY
jgi:hypothetical protein